MMINTDIKRAITEIHDIFTDLYDQIDIGGNPTVDLKSMDNKSKMVKFKEAIIGVFPNIKCTRFIITNNIDKEFFGNIVVVKDLRGAEGRKNYEIMLEVDYRIFNSNYVSADQALMYILYDIYSVVNACTSEEIFWIEDEAAINQGLSRVGLNEYKQLRDTRTFCLTDTLLKAYTLTYKCGDTVFGTDENHCNIPSTLVEMFKFTHSSYKNDGVHEQYDGSKIYEEFNVLFAYIKSIRSSAYNVAGCNYKTILLEWFMLQVKMWTTRNKDIVRELRVFYDLTASELLSTMINLAIESIGYAANNYVTNVAIQESFLGRIKKGGMKALEEDLYEYSMRVKNISDQNDAILLMRQINSRISIISDYLDTEKLNELEVRRWEGLYNRYLDLRDNLTKKPVYSRKTYGLFSDYNALMAMQQENPAAVHNILHY